MKQLIVNADDLGADEARNAGILEGIREGRITSVSILPNGPALEDSVRRLRLLGPTAVSIGFHINLTEGRPLSSGLKLLVREDGFFLGKAAQQALFLRGGDARLEKEVDQEISAQMKATLDTGLPIDHVDGHHHIHIFPAVLQPAIRIAQQYRIAWIRIPEEEPFRSISKPLSSSVIEEGRRFSAVARSARGVLKASGLRTTDHFLGLYMKGNISLPLLNDVLPGLGDGLTELMVHPGRVPAHLISGPFSAFSNAAREQELETLLDKNFHQVLASAGVRLTRFPEIRFEG